MSVSKPRLELPAAAKPKHGIRMRPQRRKAAIALLMFMSGGSLLGVGSCATLVKEAALGTTQQFVLELLDPVAIANALLGEDLAEAD